MNPLKALFPRPSIHMRDNGTISSVGIAATPPLPAHPRILPIGILMIALSVGSQSPLPAVVSVLLVLNVHGKRAFSSCSAYEFCRLQHSCYVNLGIRIQSSFYTICPEFLFGISTNEVSLL